MQMTKHLLTLAAAASMAFAANAIEMDMMDSFGTSGWGDTTYDASTQTITWVGAWTGIGWWLDGADWSAYEEFEVKVESEIGMQLVVQYSDGTNESFGLSNGVMLARLDAEKKSNITQCYIQCLNDPGTGKLISATVQSSAPLPDEAVVWEGSQALDWYPGVTIAADQFIYAPVGSEVVVETVGGEAGYSYKFCAGWSAVVLPSMSAIEGFQEEWSTVWTDQNTFSIKLAQEDMDVLKNEGGARMDICGDGATVVKVSVRYNKDESAVEAIAPAAADGVYYNLQGIRIANPTKGLYIHNGKKVVL